MQLSISVNEDGQIEISADGYTPSPWHLSRRESAAYACRIMLAQGAEALHALTPAGRVELLAKLGAVDGWKR